jgi:hypothetical protein
MNAAKTAIKLLARESGGAASRLRPRPVTAPAGNGHGLAERVPETSVR